MKFQAKILGACDLESNTISLNKEVVNGHREPFILAHAFGHFILHQKLSIGQNSYNNFSNAEYDFSKGKYEISNPRNWIEWQANYFAACFVLPIVPFRYRLGIVQETLNMAKGKVYIDDQPPKPNRLYGSDQ